jgi:PAS domain S-box-containing protein
LRGSGEASEPSIVKNVSLTISPLKNREGRVVGASKVARDITQQKQTERALRASEERFRAIVDTTPECVKLVASDGTLLHMNSSGLEMVGADRADMVVGKSVYDLIDSKDRDRFRSFNERICGGVRGSLEFDIVGLRGERRHMETYAAPLRNADGAVVQLGCREISRGASKLRSPLKKGNFPRVCLNFRTKKEGTSRANYMTEWGNCSLP